VAPQLSDKLNPGSGRLLDGALASNCCA